MQQVKNEMPLFKNNLLVYINMKSMPSRKLMKKMRLVFQQTNSWKHAYAVYILLLVQGLIH